MGATRFYRTFGPPWPDSRAHDTVHGVSATSRDESFGSVLVAFVANVAIAMAKGTAAVLTGSPALFAETLHTVADAGNEVLLFIAIRRSSMPADSSHPFGYGPERYYWALLAAIGMFVVGGAVSIWDGVHALLHPPSSRRSGRGWRCW